MDNLRVIDDTVYQDLVLHAVLCGTGSFSTIHRTVLNNTEVAIKNYCDSLEHCVIQKEFDILSNCCHPNVLQLFAAGPDLLNISFIILEYAEWGSIAKLLYDCTDIDYTLAHAVCWLLHVARALDYLHRVLEPFSVVHGDIKPANLLLFNNGRVVKVTDFGSATIMGSTVLHQTQNRQRTLVYAAPELIHNKSSGMPQLTEQCDVYSWAITLWEVLARRQPYSSCSTSNQCTTFWGVYGRRPSHLRHCPDRLWQLVTRAWDEVPSRRPRMQDVVSLLEFMQCKMMPNETELLALNRIDELPQTTCELQWEPEDSSSVDELVVSPLIPGTPQELTISANEKANGIPDSLNILTDLSLQAYQHSS